jgi:hypothetical protein
MATLLLNNVPDELLSALEQLAVLEHLPVAEKTVQLLQQVVGLRPSTGLGGLAVSPVPWEMAWRAWAAGHKPLASPAGDDRDGIYAGRGE